MADVVSWLKEEASAIRSSPDWVEALIAIEEETSCDVTVAFPEFMEERSFREFVEHLHAHRRN